MEQLEAIINEILLCESHKRPEENYKFIFKKCLKKMKENFKFAKKNKKKMKTKDFEKFFYNYYFKDISEHE